MPAHQELLQKGTTLFSGLPTQPFRLQAVSPLCLTLSCPAVLPCDQVVHDANGGTSVSDLTLIDVNTPQVRHGGPFSVAQGHVRIANASACCREYSLGYYQSFARAVGPPASRRRSLCSCCCLCACLQDVEELLARAMEKRTVGCTQLNEQSSRSHAVFTLRIEGINDSSKLKVCDCWSALRTAGQHLHET